MSFFAEKAIFFFFIVVPGPRTRIQPIPTISHAVADAKSHVVKSLTARRLGDDKAVAPCLYALKTYT